MKIVFGMKLSILAIGSVVVAPAQAQTFDPNYPVCIHIYGEQLGERMDCIFKSLAQCAMTASGLPAICLVNPYFKPNRASSSTYGARAKATATHGRARQERRSHPE